MLEAFLMLLPQTVLVYSMIYFILPRYVFTGKYLRAFGWFIVFLLLTFTVNAVFIMYIPWYKVYYAPNLQKLFAGESDYGRKLLLAYMASFQGALTGAALASSFKLFKHYYVKNIRSQQLLKENTEAQLQLLKAQIHPHFLFNTLNNIYSSTQIESPKSAKMIMELSHILRYVLDEGKCQSVLLENELLMIKDYIHLEKMRYDEKLDLRVLLPDQTDNLYIAPLLLLPFVENCFKHGASRILQHPWINLEIEVRGNTLYMKLMNGKKDYPEKPDDRKGTGIENTRRRMDLLYKDKYVLNITNDKEVFIVRLQLELTKGQHPAQLAATNKDKSHVSSGT